MKQSGWDFRKANQVTIITLKEISMTSPNKNSAKESETLASAVG